MADPLTCPHCGRRLILRDGRLVERPEPVAERTGEPDISAFAGAFKRTAAAPAAAREPRPSMSPGSRADPRPRPSPKPVSAPASALTASTSRAAPPPSRPAGGPTVLDAVESDPRLNEGQRETIRLLYRRFVPGARAGEKREGLTVAEVLDRDPNLGRGQVETIRMIYMRFVPETG